MKNQRCVAANRLALVFSAVALLLPGSRAESADEVFDAHGFSVRRDFFNQLPYEHIDPLTGNLLLTFTDLVLPGNAGLDLRIQRTYNSKIYRDYNTLGETLDEDSWAGVGWTLHLGRILNPSGPNPVLELPDGSRHKLYLKNDGTGHYMTREFWVYDLNQALLLAPNGVQYVFARQTTLPNGVAARYVTLIRDPFGNHIDIAYMNSPVDGIQTITQDLGNGQIRTVSFGLDGGGLNSLRTMTYTGRQTHTWTYTQANSNAAGFSRLTDVRPPVGPSWKYQYKTATPFVNELNGVTTPSGGQMNYTYSEVTFNIGNSFPVRSPAVTRRQTSGRDIPGGTWDYAYAQGPGKNRTVITGPCNTTTYQFLGVGNFTTVGNVWKIGLVESQSTSDGGGILETTTFSYQSSVAFSSTTEIVGNNHDSAIFSPLLQSRTINRAGQVFTTSHTYRTAFYNDLGRPSTIQENGDLSRLTERTYRYDFGPYIADDRIDSETVTVNGASFVKSFDYILATGFTRTETIYGVTTTFAPTARGNVATRTDANGHSIEFGYAWGMVNSIRRPLDLTSRVINPEGTIDSETRQHWDGAANRNTTTRFQYDLSFRPTVKHHQVGNDIVTAYDNTSGATITVQRGLGGTMSRTVTRLDGFGRVIDTTNSVGVNTDVNYDACGRKTYESYPFHDVNNGTAFEYDGLDRLRRRINTSDSPDTDVVYTYHGIDVDIEDENGRITRQNWAGFGAPSDARLMAVTDAGSHVTSYSYNAVGSLTGVDPPLGSDRVWVYNTRNQLTSESHPESGTVSYTYWPAGNLRSRTDPQFGLTSFFYDDNTRLTFIDRPGTAYDTSIDYDPSDNRKSLSNAFVASSFAYDADSRLVFRSDTVNGVGFGTGYGYDGNDNLTNLDYPSGNHVVYTYGQERRLTGVTDGAGITYATNFEYHPSGAVTSFQPGGSNARQDFGYDARYRVNSIGTGVRSMSFTYDGVGNLMSVSDSRPGMNRSFGYDSLDRLNYAAGPWGSGDFDHDAIGNRSSKTVGGSVTYSYNASTNRLTAASPGGSFSYDANGNTTGDGVRTYGYAPTNLLETAAGMTYRYDGDDLRKLKLELEPGVTRYYLHGPGAQILSEFEAGCDAVVRPARDYIYAGGRLLASRRPSTTPATVSLTSSSSSVSEGAPSTSMTVSLVTGNGAPLPCTVTVAYATSNVNAVAGQDYVAKSGTLTFPAGTPSGSTQTISVSILEDSLDEDDETFTVSLSLPTGASLGTAMHTVSILDNDPLPTLTISSATVVEGDSGLTPATFTVSLSAVSGRQLSVLYEASDGSATAGSDYLAAGGPLVIPAGSTQATITVYVQGDTTVEPDESFVVTLFAPTNVNILTSQGAGAIRNDDQEAVVWKNVVGVGVSGNTLTKAVITGWNAGASSTKALVSGDGFVEFTAIGISDRVAGFGYADSGPWYGDIAFGLHLSNGGSLYIVEAGQLIGASVGTYVSGDRFRVAIESGVVRYYRGGTLLYTSGRLPFYPLWVDDSLYDTGAVLANVTFLGNDWQQRDPVVWTDAVGVSASRNNLTKTAPDSLWSAGAISTHALVSGDGFVEFTATEATTHRMAGLGSGDTSQSFTDIEYAIYLRSDSAVEIWEAGTYHGVVGSYLPGDRFRVAVEGGVIRYRKNGTLLFASAVPPTYPLLVDTSILSPGATLADVVTSGNWQQPVRWTSPVGVSVSGYSLTKTAAAGWNAGAASTKALVAGDGFVEFTAAGGLADRIAGFGSGNTGAGIGDVLFGLNVSDGGSVHLVEAGQTTGTYLGPYQSGDRFRVSVESGVVRYLRNGTLLHTSGLAPRYPLWVDDSLFHTGAVLANVSVIGDWQSREPVLWKNPVGVSVSGNSLTKTAATGWNAGAVSTRRLISGNGAVEFTADGPPADRVGGFGSVDTGPNLADIAFGLYPSNGGYLYVVEAGQLNPTSIGTYLSGDRLRVSIEAGIVKYYRNGILLYTSSQSPQYPLSVDTAFYDAGGQISNVGIAGNWQAPEAVSWTNAVGVAVSGNNLTKTTTFTGWGDSGAVSTRVIVLGDGYAEFTAQETDKGRMFGVANGDTNQTSADIDFGLLVRDQNGSASGDQVRVVEGGTLRCICGNYSAGDVFRIAVEDGVVKYRRNGTLIYTSSTTPTYPLLVDSALYHPGATIKNAVISGTLQ